MAATILAWIMWAGILVVCGIIFMLGLQLIVGIVTGVGMLLIAGYKKLTGREE